MLPLCTTTDRERTPEDTDLVVPMVLCSFHRLFGLLIYGVAEMNSLVAWDPVDFDRDAVMSIMGFLI